MIKVDKLAVWMIICDNRLKIFPHSLLCFDSLFVRVFNFTMNDIFQGRIYGCQLA